MSAQISPIFTPMHDEEAKNLIASHEESVRKTLRNLNYIGNSLPLGTIKYINVNQPGVSPVSNTMFQFADGGEITSPSSPLRTIGLNLRFTPNMTGRFPRAALDESANVMDGSDVWNLQHSHGGNTGGMDSNGSFNGQDGDERQSTQAHTHTISDALSNSSFDWPAYIGLAPYMKIR